MRIAYIAAGAAGMYCGSCLHDNTLAAALIKLEQDVQLIPTYTPLRTDEKDVSIDRIFFGGINVFLQQKASLFRHTPWWMDRLLDRPKMLEWLASRASSIDPQGLGDLTLSMLQGKEGRQRKEIDKLVTWLKQDGPPDVVHLSNTLLSGMAPSLADQLGVPVVCSLSGEDIFLDKLPSHFCIEAYKQIAENAKQIAAFVSLSQYYADAMTTRLNLPPEKVHVIPHGLDLHGYPTHEPKETNQTGPMVIGYLARVCHDKGLHLLVEAAEKMAEQITQQSGDTTPQFKIRAAGYLGPADKPYLADLEKRVAAGPLAGRFKYVGELDRNEKLAFLQEADIFCTPTVYQESKGLPTLEALASGLPVVLPDHGSFPEIVKKTGGGKLFKAGDVALLAETLHALLANPSEAAKLGQLGKEAVHAHYTAEEMAKQTLELYRGLGC